MLNVIILGGSGALGRSVVDQLDKNPEISLKLVVREKTLSSENTVFWDYRSSIPEQFKGADVVVNCARSKDFSFNVEFNRILIRSLPSSVKLINISSNAVFAEPNGLLSRWLFKGDAYIREKKCIEQYSLNRNNIVIIRPTVVTDEGGWKSFFVSCKFADKVIAPAGGDKSRVKVTRRAYVAEMIENTIFCDDDIPLELFESIDTVGSVIGRGMVYGKNSFNYFDSAIKNFLLLILSSWMVPDSLVFILQNTLLSRTESSASNVNVNRFVIDGMTRLYLFGAHTK